MQCALNHAAIPHPVLFVRFLSCQLLWFIIYDLRFYYTANIKVFFFADFELSAFSSNHSQIKRNSACCFADIK